MLWRNPSTILHGVTFQKPIVVFTTVKISKFLINEKTLGIGLAIFKGAFSPALTTYRRMEGGRRNGKDV